LSVALAAASEDGVRVAVDADQGGGLQRIV
jgi:hypothetical protein